MTMSEMLAMFPPGWPMAAVFWTVFPVIAVIVGMAEFTAKALN